MCQYVRSLPCCLLASSVEEADGGEADSTTKVASMSGLWSAGVAALLSAYPLVFYCVHQLL